MVRACCAFLIALILICTTVFADVGYKMRYNPQTGRGDWVIDETTLPSSAINWDDALNAPYTGWTDDGDSVRLTDATDKVGIGTDSPSYGLDVNKTTFRIHNGTTVFLNGISSGRMSINSGSNS
jgi:hypothetical protein